MSYWTDRQEKLFASLEKNEEKLRARLLKLYQAEAERLGKDTAAYYARYGMDNVVEYRQLLQTLSPEDRTLLFERWDDFAKKYPQYSDLLPVRASIYNLDRLEGLKYSIDLQQLELGATENALIEQHLSKTAQDALNASMETLGFGRNFYRIDDAIVKSFVGIAWANAGDFSSRIWANRDKLANYLKTDLAQGFARGDSYDKLTRALRDRFVTVSKNDAYRLVYTEGSYVANQAAMQPFEDLFEEYSISTVGDGKVCEICRAYEGQKFQIETKVVGETFPPFHPWCRCTFIIEPPEDWDKWIDDYVATGGDPKQAKKIEDRIGGAEADKSDIISREEALEILPDYYKAADTIIDYIPVRDLERKLSEAGIIEALGGKDSTKGSCASLAFAYAGNRLGYKTTDHRGGESLGFFATKAAKKHLNDLSKKAVCYVEANTNEYVSVSRLLSTTQYGKEYILSAGMHAAVIRKVGEGRWEYLELQEAIDQCGWYPLGREALGKRFACKKSRTSYGIKLEVPCTLTDIEALRDNRAFRALLGYLNTAK